MNVLRFTGKDNRSALDQVRQHLGPEALILSSRRTARGVEICATGSLPDLSDARPPSAVSAPAPAPAVAPVAAPPVHTNEIQLAQLKRELASLRETLQEALGERRWQDTAAQRPVAATIAQRLVTLGIGRKLAGELSDAAPPSAGLDQAWQHTLQLLTRRLGSLSDAEVSGFRVKILVGASGAGKTRSAVAMLSEALRRHAVEEIAIITCGDPREASALSRVATSLNLKVFTATDRRSLADALAQCRWAREVIIDTPGLNISRGSQDPVISMLTGQRAGVAAFLVLPATGQADHLRQIAQHACALPLAGAVITKVDEAVSLGGVIDVIAGEDLPLLGRMAPERDMLVPVTGKELLSNAKRLAKRTMQRRASQLKVAV